MKSVTYCRAQLDKDKEERERLEALNASDDGNVSSESAGSTCSTKSKLARKRDKMSMKHIDCLATEEIVDQKRQIAPGNYVLATSGETSKMVLFITDVSFEKNEVGGVYYKEKEDKKHGWLFFQEKAFECEVVEVLSVLEKPMEVRVSSRRVGMKFPTM